MFPRPRHNRALWRAWRNDPDKAFADELLVVLGEREVSLGATITLTLFLAAYGAVAGTLVGLLVSLTLDPWDRRLEGLFGAFAARGAAVGTGLALIAWGILGRRLTWIRWLSWLTGDGTIFTNSSSIGVSIGRAIVLLAILAVVIPALLLVPLAVVGFLVMGSGVDLLVGLLLALALYKAARWAYAATRAASLGAILRILRAAGAYAWSRLVSLRWPAFLRRRVLEDSTIGVYNVAWNGAGVLAIWGLIASFFFLSDTRLILTYCLAGWVLAVGGCIAHHTACVAINTKCKPDRAACWWWPTRPTAMEIEAALRRDGILAWQKRLDTLDRCRRGEVHIDWWWQLHWHEGFFRDQLACTLGGRGVEWQREERRNGASRPEVNDGWVLRSVAQHSAATIGPRYRDWVCPSCVARCRPRRVGSAWNSQTIYGCHLCLESMNLIHCPGPIVLAIGSVSPGAIRSPGNIPWGSGDLGVVLEADLPLCWYLGNISELSQPVETKRIFFDRLDIEGMPSPRENAGLSDMVDRLLVHILADNERIRRYNCSATFRIDEGCRLRENTIRRLKKALRGGPAAKGGAPS